MVSLITGGNSKYKRHKQDFYPTPTASIESLLKYIHIPHNSTVLEPCAGNGQIINVLQKHLTIKPTMYDKYYYGNDDVIIKDFLDVNDATEHDWCITNPPYDSKLLMPIIKESLICARNTAMFLKLTFLESSKRYKFFTTDKSLKYVIVFSNRQPMYKAGNITSQSNAIAYAWFIWDKEYSGFPTILWEDNSNLVKKYKQQGVY